METEKKNQRRDFIKKSAVGLTAFNILPAIVLGKNFRSPNGWLNEEFESQHQAGTGEYDVNNNINIIPEPVGIKTGSGFFKLTPDVNITVVSSNKEVVETARHFSNQVATPTGFTLKVYTSAQKTGKSIVLSINPVWNDIIGEEGYLLEVSVSHVHITANKPSGIFYALQTLIQLLPASIELNTKAAGTIEWTIPCVSIMDYPRFSWRGLMLDVSRHFFSVSSVKKYIDQMVKYKYNVFHLHLSDDMGWRIEIKSLPELTRVGAWRVPRTGRYGIFDPPQPGEKATDGGFFTQEDIKELVKYARDRFVTIVPEIDVPGHSQAFIASYPAVSCTQLQTPVFAGSKDGPANNVLCAGNEETFDLLDKIFTEIATLFPGDYIHVGGDEVNKKYWKSCPKCQKIIAGAGLKDEVDLQSHFMRRIQTIILSKGKKLMGWDEILEGGLASDAAVMSWRGMKGGTEAAKAGHYVVMSPNNYAYLDRLQGDIRIELISGPGVRLSQSYKFEPITDGIDPKYILGGQGNLWTEYIATLRRAEYMTWPRGLALAEAFWSPKEKRNWPYFVRRLEANFVRFNMAQISYAPSIYDVIVIPIKDENGKTQITFSTDLDDLDVYYTFDGTFPDNFAPKYEKKPIDIPTGAGEVWAITFRNDKVAGRLLTVTIDEINKRLIRPRYNTYF